MVHFTAEKFSLTFPHFPQIPLWGLRPFDSSHKVA